MEIKEKHRRGLTTDRTQKDVQPTLLTVQYSEGLCTADRTMRMCVYCPRLELVPLLVLVVEHQIVGVGREYLHNQSLESRSCLRNKLDDRFL